LKNKEEISVQEKSRKEGAWRPDAWVTGKHRVIVDHLIKAGLQLPPAIE